MNRLAEGETVLTLACGYRVAVTLARCNQERSRGMVLLVNGALATMASFRPMTRYLMHGFDVLRYDVPYAGASAQHNRLTSHLCSEDEIVILRELLDIASPRFMISVSWGGIPALAALAERPRSLCAAIIGSFAPGLNRAMRDLVTFWISLYERRLYSAAIDSFHETLGAHLPERAKVLNKSYMLKRSEFEHMQTLSQLREVMTMDPVKYLARFSPISVPVLFVNGELDLYTTPRDASTFGPYIGRASFATLPQAGHFLSLEGPLALQRERQLVLEFLDERDEREEAVSVTED